MKTLRVLAFAFLAVVMMGACYTASVLLGWFMALLSAAGVVIAIVIGIVLFLAKLLQELWENHHDPDD